jgi:hypothetical protein
MFRSILIRRPPLEIYADDLGYTIVVPLACCPETDRIVSVDSHLSPLDDAWEFSFEITVSSLDDTEPPFSTQDRTVASNYIPVDVRPNVMLIVCASLLKLLAHVKPERVYRVTKGRNLPREALHKHQLLTEVLVAMGYTMTDSGTDSWKRVFWVFER